MRLLGCHTLLSICYYNWELTSFMCQLLKKKLRYHTFLSTCDHNWALISIIGQLPNKITWVPQNIGSDKMDELTLMYKDVLFKVTIFFSLCCTFFSEMWKNEKENGQFLLNWCDNYVSLNLNEVSKPLGLSDLNTTGRIESNHVSKELVS